MSDTISREALITVMETLCDESKPLDVLIRNVSVAAIKKAPAVDAVEVVHGHWIHTGLENVYGGHQHKCSVCDYSLMVSPMCDNDNYCCNCGAKMDEVTHE